MLNPHFLTHPDHRKLSIGPLLTFTVSTGIVVRVLIKTLGAPLGFSVDLRTVMARTTSYKY